MSGYGGQPIGHLVDAAGVRSALADGELIESFLVVMKVHTDRASPSVRTAWSEGMSWIDRRALIEIARDVERVNPNEDGENP